MNDLVVDQRVAESFALFAVVDGGVDAVLQALDHVGRAEQALFLELQHLHHKTGTFVADAIALRHAYVVEEHLSGLRTAHAEFVQVRAESDAWGVHRHHDQRFIDVRFVVAGIGQQADKVSGRGVGDPHLAAVDHVVAAVFLGRGFQPGDIRAGADFGNADTADHLAGNCRFEEFFAQLIGAEARQRRGTHIGLYADGHRNAAADDGAEFFGRDD